MLNEATITATAAATGFNARQVKRIVSTACDVFTCQNVHEDWDYEAGTAVCYLKTSELPTIGLLQNETGARLAFCPISAEALTLIAPVWFVSLFVLRCGALQEEAARLGRDLIDNEDDFDFRGDVNRVIVENVFNQRDVKLCDVDRYPMAIPKEDEDAKNGLQLIRAYGYDCYQWPYECAREVGAHCDSFWPEWAQRSFILQVLWNAPTTSPHTANQLREDDERVCTNAYDEARANIISECAGVDSEEMDDRLLALEVRIDELQTEIAAVLRDAVCYA